MPASQWISALASTRISARFLPVRYPLWYKQHMGTGNADWRVIRLLRLLSLAVEVHIALWVGN